MKAKEKARMAYIVELCLDLARYAHEADRRGVMTLNQRAIMRHDFVELTSEMSKMEDE